MLGIHYNSTTKKYFIEGDEGIVKAAGEDLSSIDSSLPATYEDVARAYRKASDSFIDDTENKTQRCKEYMVIRNKFLTEQNSKVIRKGGR